LHPFFSKNKKMSEVQVVIDQTGDVRDINAASGGGADQGGLGLPNFAPDVIQLNGGTTTLTASAVGQIHETTGTTGGTINLPLVSEVEQGARLMIRIGQTTFGGNSTEIQPQGTDVIQGAVPKLNGQKGLATARGVADEFIVFNGGRKGEFLVLEAGASKWILLDGVGSFIIQGGV
jgi:hypothetical protein